MAYDLNFTNSTDTFFDLVINVNEAVGGMFIYMFLASLYFVLVLILMKSDKNVIDSFFVSSIVMSGITIFFFAAGVVPANILAIPIVLMALTGIARGFL